MLRVHLSGASAAPAGMYHRVPQASRRGWIVPWSGIKNGDVNYTSVKLGTKGKKKKAMGSWDGGKRAGNCPPPFTDEEAGEERRGALAALTPAAPMMGVGCRRAGGCSPVYWSPFR